jgi:hypothetical protein
MPQGEIRVVGSGFTTFRWRNQTLAFLDKIKDSGQMAATSKGDAYEPITPIGWRHPKEIVVNRVLSEGSLVLTLRELWNGPVWQQLNELAAANNLLDVFDALAADPAEVSCQMVIKPPGSQRWRGNTYHNCAIVAIDDAETIEAGALSVSRTFTAIYTHKTPLELGQ